MLGSIKGPDSSDAKSSSSASKLLVVLSNCRTRSARNGDGSNKFGAMDAAEDADADADNDDGSNEFNSDADVDNNDTGANTDADDGDNADNDEDIANCANDACKFVSTVIGDITSCCSVITDDAVKDNVPNDDKVAAAAASSILFLVHAFAFRPRCCAIADAVFFPFFEFKI